MQIWLQCGKLLLGRLFWPGNGFTSMSVTCSSNASPRRYLTASQTVESFSDCSLNAVQAPSRTLSGRESFDCALMLSRCNHFTLVV